MCEFPLLLASVGVTSAGCVGVASLVQPPPPVIQITIAPPSGVVILGKTLTFVATVTNTTDKVVSWSVNGIPGGSAASGTISASGLYTAPANLPSPVTIQVTATSHADTSKSATVTVTIASDITVAVTPGAANVELGATQTFQATINSSGNPDNALQWSVLGPSGTACTNG